MLLTVLTVLCLCLCLCLRSCLCLCCVCVLYLCCACAVPVLCLCFRYIDNGSSGYNITNHVVSDAPSSLWLYYQQSCKPTSRHHWDFFSFFLTRFFAM